jgi:hypothetical protein
MDNRDADELRKLYKDALALATELTADKPDLFKTVFNCLYWEGCHYVYGRKLKELKKN